jgi:hypothetical protein
MSGNVKLRHCRGRSADAVFSVRLFLSDVQKPRANGGVRTTSGIAAKPETGHSFRDAGFNTPAETGSRLSFRFGPRQCGAAGIPTKLRPPGTWRPAASSFLEGCSGRLCGLCLWLARLWSKCPAWLDPRRLRNPWRPGRGESARVWASFRGPMTNQSRAKEECLRLALILLRTSIVGSRRGTTCLGGRSCSVERFSSATILRTMLLVCAVNLLTIMELLVGPAGFEPATNRL